MPTPTCPLYRDCPFFNETLPDMPSTVTIMKNKFCAGDYIKCARYKVATTVGREHVKTTLFPRNIEEAERVIASCKGDD